MPACNNCPYSELGRCEGAITRGSMELERDEGLIGCHDATRIKKFYDYLRTAERIPPQPSWHNRLSLPGFIPVLETGMPSTVELDPSRLYGVYLRSIINPDATFKYRNAQTLRDGLHLPHAARLALFLTAGDPLIESAWYFSVIRDIWQRIAALDFEFVTSATFSVYDDDPRSDQIFNQDRNFRTYDIFCRLGVPCIPFLFFNASSDLDYRNIIGWLRTHSDVKKVAILAHSFRHRTAFRRLLTQTRSIAQDVERTLQFVFVGAAKIDKIRLVLSEYADAVFVTPQPVSKGRVGELITPGLKSTKVDANEAAAATLIRANIEQFDQDIDGARLRYSPPETPLQRLLPFYLPPFLASET